MTHGDQEDPNFENINTKKILRYKGSLQDGISMALVEIVRNLQEQLKNYKEDNERTLRSHEVMLHNIYQTIEQEKTEGASNIKSNGRRGKP